MLAYALGLALSTIESRKFRDCVLRELVTLYRDLEIPDYVNMCQCFIFLDDPDSVAKVLEKLSKQSEVRFIIRVKFSNNANNSCDL